MLEAFQRLIRRRCVVGRKEIKGALPIGWAYYKGI